MATTRDQRRAWGHFPSEDADVATALELLEWSWYRFARSTEGLAAETARGVLQRLEAWEQEPGVRTPERRRAASLFLRAAVDDLTDEAVSRTWRPAVIALKAFESQYAWGSKEKRARLAAVQADARLVEACRAAVVGCTQLPLELLAVLALDGTEASADALLPHVDRAMADQTKLEALARLERFAAPTKAMTSLMTLLLGRLREARQGSPVLELARRLGLSTGERFRVELVLTTEHAKARAFLNLDSDRPGPAFLGRFLIGPGNLMQAPKTAFHGDDGSTRCSIDGLPAHLKSLATGVGEPFFFQWPTARHLRGQRLKTFIAWLQTAP